MRLVYADKNTVFVPKYASVKVCGNVTEVTEMLACSRPQMVNISKDEMLNLATGVVVQKHHADNKADSLKSVKQSLKHIRDLVNVNCVQPSRIRWCTFTYAENMTDTERLYRDWDAFRKRFRRWCAKTFPDLSDFEYISVVEPQARGAWHLHVFFLWECDAPFIPNEVLARIWGHGFVNIKAVSNVDNIGAYFSAYLADISVDDVEGKSVSGDVVERVSDDGRTTKKYIKGGRLYLYPSNMQICRHSRGIKYPVVERCSPDDAQKKKATAGTVTFSGIYELLDDDGNIINIVRKSYYNSVRCGIASVENSIELGSPECLEYLAEFLEEKLLLKSADSWCRKENSSLSEYISEFGAMYERFVLWVRSRYSVSVTRSCEAGHAGALSQAPFPSL